MESGTLTASGTRKVTVHLRGRDQENFDAVRRYLSPVDPRLCENSQVMRWCLEQARRVVEESTVRRS